MKKFILFAAMTAMAMMSTNAWAQKMNHSSDRRATGMRVEKVERAGKAGHMAAGKKAMRPKVGTRLANRPIGGKYFYKGANRYLLVDGVLYKEVYIGAGKYAFVVEGYIF